MKQVVKLFLLFFFTAAVGGSLRMFFPGLSWVYWPERLHSPPQYWAAALVGAPLLELWFFGIAYVIVNGLFLLLVKGVYKDKLTLRRTLLLSATHSLVGYIVVAGTQIWRSSGLETPFTLAGIYIVAGLVYGLLYYRWMIAAKAANTATS